MTDRPIIMQGHSVRAMLDGSKTQSRRLAWRFVPGKNPPAEHLRGKVGHYVPTTWKRLYDEWQAGQREQRLWVRESWRDAVLSYGYRYGPAYRATCLQPHVYRWRPSIHLPRLASRITLLVTDVRMQRLTEIDETDALAEGADGPHPESWHPDAGEVGPDSYRDGFRELWDSINAKRAPWDSNPDVIAISFVAHQTNIDSMDEAA